MTVAGANKDSQAQQLIVGGLKGVSVVSSKLLLAAKSLHSDPTAPNAKNLLAQAARNVTESINSLIGEFKEQKLGINIFVDSNSLQSDTLVIGLHLWYLMLHSFKYYLCLES